MARREDRGDVVAVSEYAERVLDASRPGALEQRTRVTSADDEQPGVGSAARHDFHGVDDVIVPLRAADAHLRDQKILGTEPQLLPNCAPVAAGVKTLGIRSRVDHLDLRRWDAGGDQTPLDRLADRHDRRHPR